MEPYNTPDTDHINHWTSIRDKSFGSGECDDGGV
jgi:hypothetical protein